MEEEGGFLDLLSSGDGEEHAFLLSSSTTSHMLCFASASSTESSLSSSPPLPSTTSSTVTTTATTISKSTTKKGGGSSKKKTKISSESSSVTTSGTMRVRKEKLGERIMALQQLVSPFGKSDTASVLHEALGYIRFLHDQVQVLSLPYMQRLPTPPATLHDGGEGGSNELRSRGLCLVPVSCTDHVANNNGADIWSPSSMGSNSSSASKH
ncbi:transcription factor bHLH113-like [Dioscorea cayenensis subsp. rotundata]|uniref:Transcription factor bHLH113-like n=1 Tax=Dioscorea cayennensis subsp. rotundata TaxID=55577 RepID=A0AB40CM98_DIOCR|nr:transcription factor bHLH113-like [Dioscorea cayenensis subsp. rotundata]